MRNAQSFQKGQSGNPSGRPKVVKEVQILARMHTTLAMQTLVNACKDDNCPWPARVTAAIAILDRGYGKPTQEHTGANGAPLIPSLVLKIARDTEDA